MADKSGLIQEEVSVFCVELTNMDLDEKRVTKGLKNCTHIVSRNTFQREMVCSSLTEDSREDGWRRI